MKRTKTILAMIFIAAIAFSFPVYADDEANVPGNGDKDRKAKIAKRLKDRAKKCLGAMFKKMDKNGDGVITLDELPTAEERMAKLDGDGDGQVTKEELAAALKNRREQMKEKIKEKIKERVEQRFKKADADGDGFISKDEFKGRDEIFDKIDTDGDGQLSKEELKDAVKKFRKKMQERRKNRRGAKGERGNRGGRGNHGGRGQ